MRFCIVVNIFCPKADQAGGCPCEEFFCYFQQPRRLGPALVVYDTLPMCCWTVQGNTSPLGVAGNAWEQAKLLATPAHWCMLGVFLRPPPMGCTVAPMRPILRGWHLYWQSTCKMKQKPEGHPEACRPCPFTRPRWEDTAVRPWAICAAWHPSESCSAISAGSTAAASPEELQLKRLLVFPREKAMYR